MGPLTLLMLTVAMGLASLEAEPGVGDLDAALSDLTSGDLAARTAAFQKVLSLDADGQKQLLSRLVEPGMGDDAGARFAVHGLAAYLTQPGQGAKRQEFAKVLCRHLESDAPPAVKQFVIQQLQLAGREESVPALAACLTDEALAEAARQALLANPTEAAATALREALPKTKGTVRAGILFALGQRRDRSAVEAILADARTGDPEVRLAAAEALGRLGDMKGEPVIAAALGKGDDRERRAAFASYLRLAEQLAADGKRADAATVYAKALGGASRAYQRRSAILGLGTCGSAKVVDAVLPFLTNEDASVRAAATACLASLPDPAVPVALARAMGKSPPPIKGALLRVLARRKEPGATEAIAAATKDTNAEVRVTALELMGKLDDPALEGTLLEAAESGSDAIRPVAVGAYLKLAEARAQNDKDGARAMFTRGFDLAGEGDLRRAALRGLALTASAESLPKVEAALGDEGLREEAVRTYAAIGSTVADTDKARAIDMLRKALGMAPPRDVGESAVRRLRELGVEVDPAREAGFVTDWWVVGPWAGTDIDKEFPPEKGVDLGGAVEADGNQVRWQKHHTNDLSGRVNLLALLEPNTNRTAYAYAEVRVDPAQDVLLKVGSDDGLKCWLNGQAIHKFPQPRSLRVDEDTVETRLESGANKLLVKVYNGGGGWEFCLRITDRDGKPVAFRQE